MKKINSDLNNENLKFHSYLKLLCYYRYVSIAQISSAGGRWKGNQVGG